MPFIELFDETLDINSTQNYDLSIQAGSDGFAFCLLDTIRNKYVLLRSFEPEDNKYFNANGINEIISKDDFLNRRFRKVRYVIPTRKFTVVPSALFDPGRKDQYFTFNHLTEEAATILSNKLEDPDAYLVFSAPKAICDLLNSFHTGIFPNHHLKPLLMNISHNRKSVTGNYLHLHVEREYFNLILFDHNSLRFCNAFNYRNISDILYYVLNVFRTLGLKQEETIHLSGQTEKYDDLSSNLSIYIRNIRFAEPSGSFTFSYVFNDTALHRFINLFSLAGCE